MLKCIYSDQSNQVQFLLASLVYTTTLSVKSFLGGKVQQHEMLLLQIYITQL